jgi:hypothetical protein
LLISAGAASAAETGLNPADGTILPADAGNGLLHQCSRGTPEHITGTWDPAAAQIRELESRLPAALALEAQQRGNRYVQPATFRRQYTGLLIGNRRIVYVNAFPHDTGDSAKEGTSATRNFDWHREPVVVCDGGPAFFGVEYDSARKTFAHFEFNGPL